ncbi:MAG: carboxymuconolactone decarboxylase family protein [Nitrospiraceae bacterium]
MRLRILERGHRLRARVALRIMRVVGGGEPDDVIKTSLYRPAFFGRPWIGLLREVMRGPSEWTAGERELFAAHTSRLNTCPYCVGIHTQTATLGLRANITVQLLDRWRSSPFRPQIRAVLELLEKITSASSVIAPGDIERVRAAGVSDAAIVDALHVCFVFNVVNRLANAFGHAAASEGDQLAAARALHRFGYRLPGFLLQ